MITCRFKDGTPVSEHDADAIMRALGFTSAREAERIIGNGEKRRRQRRERIAREDRRQFTAEAAQR